MSFVYSPLTVERPFSVGRMRSVGLSRMAQDAGAAFVAARVEDVDTDAKDRSGSRAAERIEYDALVLAVGAEAIPPLEYVMTWTTAHIPTWWVGCCGTSRRATPNGWR